MRWTGLGRPAVGWLLLGAAVVGFALLWVRTAWIGDDALITMRAVHNWVHGNGLTWNPGERVQVFTHPLWMLLIAPLYAVAGDPYVALLVPSALCTVGTLWVLVRRLAPGLPAAAFGVVALAASRAVLDYTSSGLENPLSFLLITLILARHLRPGPEALHAISALGGLLVLNRMDLILLIGPVFAVHLWAARGEPRRAAAALALLGGPALVWAIGSTFYFGFPVPNTATAKLNTGIPALDMVRQGLWYYAYSALHDPITLVLAFGGPLLALRQRVTGARPVALGIGWNGLYLVWIGGDFMGGRFFGVLVLAGLALLLQVEVRRYRVPAVALALVLGLLPLVSLPASADPPPGPGEAGNETFHGIVDERAWYYAQLGLLSPERADLVPAPDDAPRSSEVVPRTAVGRLGYVSGGSVTLLDLMAIGDPLLARLPALKRKGWRPGHYLRLVPRGYPETLATGQVQLKDRALAEYYYRLKLVVSGPLWSAERLYEVWRFNTGQNDHLVRRERYREPPTLTLTPDELAWAPQAVTPAGLRVPLPGPLHADTVHLQLSARHAWRVSFVSERQTLATVTLPPEHPKARGVTWRSVAVPEAAAQAGYDLVRIVPEALRSDHQFEVRGIWWELTPTSAPPPRWPPGSPSGRT